MKKGQRSRLIILICIAVVIIIAVSVFLNQKSYTVLYSGMDAKDAGEVLTRLDELNVDAKPQGSDTILVSSEDADRIRMQLASEGYPASGYNFDIFKNASGLGTTDMEKKVYLQFQLNQNLAQTIKRLDKVEDAVVNINLPDESPFVLSENNKPASAAVMLKLKNGQTVSNEEVRAIGELVSKSVSGLKLEDVRIIDSKMHLYKLDSDSETENVGTQLALEQSIQERLQKQIINLLSPVFGQESVLAEVNVKLNFDAQTTESVVFTPPAENNEGLVVSMKELAESVRNGAEGGVPGMDSNGGAAQYPELTDEDTVYNKISKEANMEINETRTQIENAKGQIKDLSVSVILDSSENAEDHTDNVSKLVATAIGVTAERITVAMLPFKKMETAEVEDALNAQKQLMSDVQSASTMRLIIIALACLAVMFILLAIIKTLKKGKYEYAAETAGYAGEVDLTADEEIIPEPVAAEIEEKEDTNLSQLEKYIDKSPESVAQLLRNWLSDEYGR